ncbi:hypothetical protein [Cellulomonas denverensis]|uniref:hypothetical protein n=1 Tax=Cellulomonas denverensis TaxID=264297 RepID=UPI0035ECEB14
MPRWLRCARTPSVVAERLRPDPGVLAIWLAGELAGRRALLVVDDLDRLDAVSATVVLDALRRSRARMLATAGRDLSRVHGSAVAELVAERAPAEVLLRPRGFAAISRLLAEELGAPVDVALASSLTARADGNPKVALAIADAARFSGAIELDGDRWRTVGPLDGLPLAAVAHALLPPAGCRAGGGVGGAVLRRTGPPPGGRGCARTRPRDPGRVARDRPAAGDPRGPGRDPAGSGGRPAGPDGPAAPRRADPAGRTRLERDRDGSAQPRP